MSDWALISESTASGASSVSFTDLTGYKIFKFVFIDVNPATNTVSFQFQVNASGQTGYNETMTTTFFHAEHEESDGSTELAYKTSLDQAQGTAYQHLIQSVGNGADECCSGELHLFNPASTTYVKHFYSNVNTYSDDDKTANAFVAGYINVTAAITGIDFKMSSGNLDAVIKQYGLVAT